MTGTGISVDGYDITVCGGRDVAGGSTGGLYITFESGATYSHLSDQPGTYDGSGCFYYHGYLDETPITAVTVDGIGDWTGSNWWVDDPPLPPPPPEPEPEPVPPPNPPSAPADSPEAGGEMVMPDFSPVPMAVDEPGETAPVPKITVTPKPVKTSQATVAVPVEDEPVTDFAVDPVTAMIAGGSLLVVGGGAFALTKWKAWR